MYSEELENLIEAALADGELTEKEKQILFKKAQGYGIDLDEFEMVLGARLVKLKKATTPTPSAPKSNKFGDIKKCPACGAMVQSFQGSCPECGYAFENLEANTSTQKLYDTINQILSARSKQSIWSDNSGERVDQAIRSFPVPSTKADLLEFIITLKQKTKDNEYGDAYYAKYKECVEKARFMFPNDNDFARVFESQKTGWWGSLSPEKRKMIIVVIFGIIIPILTIIAIFAIAAN